jgi:hypothetical protein
MPDVETGSVEKKFCAKSVSVSLDPGSIRKVNGLAAQAGVSVAVVLFTAWQVLLRRLTGGVAVLVALLVPVDGNGQNGRPPYTRVEDMAAHYLRDILEFQPEGPYYLEGMSFGGLVALEMAQMLKVCGRVEPHLSEFLALESKDKRSSSASGAMNTERGFPPTGVICELHLPVPSGLEPSRSRQIGVPACPGDSHNDV